MAGKESGGPAGMSCGWSGVRVELLSTFACVAHELHFSRAAKLLHLSQPGLSRRIAQLERCLGEVLLDRSSRRVTLTPAGEALLPHAVAILEHAALAASAVQPGSTVAIGRFGMS